MSNASQIILAKSDASRALPTPPFSKKTQVRNVSSRFFQEKRDERSGTGVVFGKVHGFDKGTGVVFGKVYGFDKGTGVVFGKGGAINVRQASFTLEIQSPQELQQLAVKI